MEIKLSPKKNSNATGFTLLEIMIALFILAVVLTTIFGAYTGTFRIISETESQADIYAMARVALERIQEDLESVYISKADEDAVMRTRFVGEDRQINERSADSMRFISKAHVVFDKEERDPGTTEIYYDVRKSPEEDSLVLFRSDTPEFQGSTNKGPDGLILCENLFSVNFIYYDTKGRDSDTWDSTYEENRSRLPVRVSILLEFVNKANPKEPLRFMTGIAIPMAGDKYGKGF
ncbi:MAG: prepilin-type N-terminal cleavage/methylation domain-containing protein [Desulfobacterales bacterium]|nr:prepilin-type N-terminal cleavage/methylation domain-containing protein [Desulfobacterales bacterium]